VELTYARWLAWCTGISLAALALAFLLYLLRIAEPLVPLEQLPALWSLPVEQFLAATGAPAGWGWLAQAGRGDYLNVVGVAMLCGVTLVCYARILVRPGDRVTRALALAQMVVLLAAASGLLAGGH
jgi:hypothetical protein